jgi:metallo-beta-lactamase family protein
MKITFWGATEGVTGSKTYVEMPEGHLMIDCGMIQGEANADELNRQALPFQISDVKAIIITHAHLDHSGFLPRMVKKGFKGNIYCTPPTSKLIRVILLDSAGLVGEDFYDEHDVHQTLSLIRKIEWHETTELLGGSFQFQTAGHILGASSVIIKSNGKKVVFSGDLGRSEDPLIPPPLPCPEADLIVMESTYGGKIRQGDIQKELHSFLVTISRESRIGIIASFAVARAQMLMTLIYEFYQRHPEEKVRVVTDSPMMKEASQIYKQYAHLTYKKDSLFSAINEFEVIEHQREWLSLKKKSGPLIIISSSGMLTGGRIRRHLENWQDDSRAILFLSGYQAEGTPGRAFLEGQRKIHINDEDTLHWSGEVWNSDAFSSHADQAELLEWLKLRSKTSPIYLVHGEESSKIAFKAKLNELGFEKVVIPIIGSAVLV